MKCVFSIVILLLVSGCASTLVIKDSKLDAIEGGLPVLIKNVKGNPEVVYLSVSKPRIFGKSSFSVELSDDGYLKKVSVNTESTAGSVKDIAGGLDLIGILQTQPDSSTQNDGCESKPE